MLQVKLFINSSVEQVLNFKCCNLPDQNFEIHLTNTGPEPLLIPSHCDLENEAETKRLDYLYPPGPQTLPPGETMAFYCTLDDRVLARFQRIVFYDCAGRRYEQAIRTFITRSII